MAQDFS